MEVVFYPTPIDYYYWPHVIDIGGLGLNFSLAL